MSKTVKYKVCTCSPHYTEQELKVNWCQPCNKPIITADYGMKLKKDRDELLKACKSAYKVLNLDSDMQEDFAEEIELLYNAIATVEERKITHYFLDNLDGIHTLFKSNLNGTETVYILDENNHDDNDVWLYPKDLHEDNIVNVFINEDKPQINVYDLPDNWKELVTKDNGKDNKQSIHDIMIARG